jgi:hypothetical protein
VGNVRVPSKSLNNVTFRDDDTIIAAYEEAAAA